MIDLAEGARHTKLHLRLWLPLCRIIAAPLLWLLGPVRGRGAYRVPKEGGVLILANHLSDIDPMVVQATCSRPIHFMAKSELFDIPILGRLQREFGAFPVRRGAPDRAALKQAAKLLEAGEVVCIFPEGQVSEDGLPQDVKGGVALIIRMAAETSVICCGLRGTDRIIPYGKIIPRPAFHKVEATWGEPKIFDTDTPSERILAWVSGQLRDLAT